jgi:integrase
LAAYVLPVFGHERLIAINRPRLQRWIGALIEDGLSASSIRNTLGALRVLYRHAVEVGEVTFNPTTGLRLPAQEKHQPRIVPPEQAAKLVAVLPFDDAVIWATAFYAGLRRGELWGLRIPDVDLGEGVLRVRHNEDVIEGRVDPKSAAGFRPVPIIDQLASLLSPHLKRVPKRYGRELRDEDRVFPGERAARFSDSALVKRSKKVWEATKLTPVGLHDCRHTFASFGIAAGWNAKTLQVYMGHSSIIVTYDIYGHLFPGSEAEAAALLTKYLDAVANRAATDVESAF